MKRLLLPSTAFIRPARRFVDPMRPALLLRAFLVVCVCSAVSRCSAQYLGTGKMFPGSSGTPGLTKAERKLEDTFSAIEDGDKVRFLALLKSGVDPNGRADIYGMPLLHAAVRFERIEMMRALLDRGARVNLRSAEGTTALMDAALYGCREAAKLLLAKGAWVNRRSADGKTALMCAAERADPEMVRILLRAGARVNAQGTRGDTALMAGTGYRGPLFRMHTNTCQILRLLLDHKAHVNLRDRDGLTALARAAKQAPSVGGIEPVRLLLERGADPNTPDAEGDTPLIHACLGDNPDLVRLLLEHGADVNAQAKDGTTALHMASRCRAERTVTLLLRCGAKADLKNRNGQTAGDLAAEGGFKELAERLKRVERETDKPESVPK